MNRPGPEKGAMQRWMYILGPLSHSISISSWLQRRSGGQQGDLMGTQRDSTPCETAAQLAEGLGGRLETRSFFFKHL